MKHLTAADVIFNVTLVLLSYFTIDFNGGSIQLVMTDRNCNYYYKRETNLHVQNQ